MALFDSSMIRYQFMMAVLFLFMAVYTSIFADLHAPDVCLGPIMPNITQTGAPIRLLANTTSNATIISYSSTSGAISAASG